VRGKQADTRTLIYEPGDNGWWLAHVPAIPGCHTQGRTLDQTRERIREALSLWVEDADKVTLVDDVRAAADARDP
jgi:predicted RNase H-like HicB family nuclease